MRSQVVRSKERVTMNRAASLTDYTYLLNVVHGEGGARMRSGWRCSGDQWRTLGHAGTDRTALFEDIEVDYHQPGPTRLSATSTQEQDELAPCRLGRNKVSGAVSVRSGSFY